MCSRQEPCQYSGVSYASASRVHHTSPSSATCAFLLLEIAHFTGYKLFTEVKYTAVKKIYLKAVRNSGKGSSTAALALGASLLWRICTGCTSVAGGGGIPSSEGALGAWRTRHHPSPLGILPWGAGQAFKILASTGRVVALWAKFALGINGCSTPGGPVLASNAVGASFALPVGCAGAKY
jgi:hypothetical protein